jgi:hypothetical protein
MEDQTVRIAVLQVGPSLGAHARFITAILASEGLEVPFCDVPTKNTSAAPSIASDRAVICLELELGAARVVDENDADSCYASRSVVRGVLGLCDGSTLLDDELTAATHEAREAALRIHQSCGPPGSLAPHLMIFVFAATEHQLENSTAYGPEVRFITSAALLGDPSLLLHLRFLLADFTCEILTQLDNEAAALQRLEEMGQPPETGHDAISGGGVASSATGAARRSAPPAVGTAAFLELGLSSGLGSISVALGALKRRWTGRLAMCRAGVLVCMCSPLDALEVADKAAKSLRSSSPDWLFLGLLEHVRASAVLQRARHYSGYSPRVGAPHEDMQYLPDVAASLREAVGHFDAAAAAAQQDAGAGAASDIISQLAVSARVRLARYIHTRPPERALMSLSRVLGCSEDAVLQNWCSSCGGSDGGLSEPAPASAAMHALEASRFTAAALIPAASRQSSAGEGTTGGSVAAFWATMASSVAAVVSTPVTEGAGRAIRQQLSSSGSGVSGLSVGGSPAGGAGDRSALLAETLDLLTVASARAREIRSPQFQARALLLCADLFELGGLWRRSEACIFRASRLLRTLQVVPSLEHFAAPTASVAAVHRSSCLYHSAINVSGRGSLPRVGGCAATAPAAWPLPWVGIPPEEDATALVPPPVPFLVSPSAWPSFRPALVSATLLLTCIARDGPTQEAIAAYSADCVIDARVASSRGGPAAPSSPGPKILLPFAAATEWAGVLVADFWACGELPLALCTSNLLSMLQQQTSLKRDPLRPVQNDRTLSLPHTTSALITRTSSSPLPEATTVPELVSASTSPSLPNAPEPVSPPTRASIEYAQRLLLTLQRRRVLCSVAAAAVTLRSPLSVLRTVLNGMRVSPWLTPVDALIVVKLLGAFAAEGALLDAHRAEPISDLSSSACVVETWRPPSSNGLVDALLAPLCPCYSGALRAFKKKGPAVTCETMLDRSGAPCQLSSLESLSSDGRPAVEFQSGSLGSDLAATLPPIPAVFGDDMRWQDPRLFAESLATYLGRSVCHEAPLCSKSARGMRMIRVEQEPDDGEHFPSRYWHSPAFPCCPVEIDTLRCFSPSVCGTGTSPAPPATTSVLDWMPVMGTQRALDFQHSRLSVRVVAAAKPKINRRLAYDVLQSESDVARPGPQVHATVEFPSDATHIHITVVLRNSAPVPVSGVISLIFSYSSTDSNVTAPPPEAVPSMPVSVSIQAQSTRQFSCLLPLASFQTGSAPLLLSLSAVLFCSGNSTLHRIDVVRDSESAVGDTPKGDWDLRVVWAATPKHSEPIMAPPPRSTHLHPRVTTPANLAAAMGWTVYGTTWCT